MTTRPISRACISVTAPTRGSRRLAATPIPWKAMGWLHGLWPEERRARYANRWVRTRVCALLQDRPVTGDMVLFPTTSRNLSYLVGPGAHGKTEAFSYDTSPTSTRSAAPTTLRTVVDFSCGAATEFPRIDDRLTGRAHRYVAAVGARGKVGWSAGERTSLSASDMTTGRSQTFDCDVLLVRWAWPCASRPPTSLRVPGAPRPRWPSRSGCRTGSTATGSAPSDLTFRHDCGSPTYCCLGSGAAKRESKG